MVLLQAGKKLLAGNKNCNMRRHKSDVKMQAYVQSYHIKIFLNSNKGKKSLEGSQVSICGVSEIEYGPNQQFSRFLRTGKKGLKSNAKNVLKKGMIRFIKVSPSFEKNWKSSRTANNHLWH